MRTMFPVCPNIPAVSNLKYYEVGLLVAGLFTGFVQSVLVGVREGNENVVVQLAEAIEKIKP